MSTYGTSLGLVDCAYKRWLSNTNFGNPANWNAGRAPCGNDVAVIHDESAAVFLQVNTTVKQLVSETNNRNNYCNKTMRSLKMFTYSGFDEVYGMKHRNRLRLPHRMKFTLRAN